MTTDSPASAWNPTDVSKNRNAYRIRFTYKNRRHELRLPGATKRQADAISGHVESLISSSLSNLQPDTAASTWIGGVDDKIFNQLRDIGLVKSRRRADRTETLSSFTKRFIARGISNTQVKVKPITLGKWKLSANYLNQCFGEDVGVDNVTVADASYFRSWLEEQPGMKAEDTFRKHCQLARMFFNAAIDNELIGLNPFRKVPVAFVGNEDKKVFVPREQVVKLAEHALCSDWETLFMMARIGGFRCGSEAVAAEWDHVHWDDNKMTVRCIKTEGKPGKETRVIPLWPELRETLERHRNRKPLTDKFIITRFRDPYTNLRTEFFRTCKRAGVEPWVRPFQNMRSSRSTELVDSGVKEHVASAWLGHSVKVQKKSYLTVAEHHFENHATV